MKGLSDRHAVWYRSEDTAYKTCSFQLSQQEIFFLQNKIIIKHGEKDVAVDHGCHISCERLSHVTGWDAFQVQTSRLRSFEFTLDVLQ